MCGIIYTEGKKAIVRAINQFHQQKSRGTEGFGAVLIKKNGNYEIIRNETQRGFIDQIEDKKNIYAVLMHHRYPTSTDNEIEQTHPIKTNINNTIYLTVHNGVISNTHDLKEKHYSEGLFYTTKIKTTKVTALKRSVRYDWNDSESLAVELAKYFERQSEEVQARGNIAFITLVIKNNKVEKMYLGRNSNPLILKRKSEKLTIASELKKGTSIKTHVILQKKFGVDFKFTETAFRLKEHYPNFGYDYKRIEQAELSDYERRIKNFKRDVYEDDKDDFEDIDFMLGYEGEISIEDEIKLTQQAIESIKNSKPLDKEELAYAKEHLKELKQIKRNS
jgi:predicted glutamine amidotransferase